ncbi:MAG: hypothetical protein ACOC6A_03720, partial [Chloroflexota bacterium]
MFYNITVPEVDPKERVAALVTLNPSESRRLLAKAVVGLPEVRNAWKNGIIIIARGITDAYVTEELLGETLEPKAAQTVGMVVNGMTNANSGPPASTSHVIRKGKVVENADSTVEILDFGPEDVFIKGANAVDPEGNAAIMASSVRGGTWGSFTPIVTPRNSHLIIAVGLEKMVASVFNGMNHSGIYHFKYSTGVPAKLVPAMTGKVVTEIQALALLAGVRAFHVCSGGVGGSEGAVTLALEGDDAHVRNAFELVKSVKGEPPVTLP